MHEDAAIAGLRHIADHVSLTGPEFARAMRSPMLLDGLRSRGWVNERDGRVAISKTGERVLSHSASKCDGKG